MKKICRLIFWVILSVSCGDDDESPAADAAIVEGDADVARQTFNLVNDHRQSRKLAPLTWNDAVAESALEHSRNMASGAVEPGHDGWDDRKKRLAATISYSGAAENVAINRAVDDPAAVAVASWLNSPGHRENIERDYGSISLTGMGVTEGADGTFYFTQIFLKSN